jgi:hypothetical protein
MYRITYESVVVVTIANPIASHVWQQPPQMTILGVASFTPITVLPLLRIIGVCDTQQPCRSICRDRQSADAIRLLDP